jgi:hypothetical protein
VRRRRCSSFISFGVPPEDWSAVAVPLSRHGSVSALMGTHSIHHPPRKECESGMACDMATWRL